MTQTSPPTATLDNVLDRLPAVTLESVVTLAGLQTRVDRKYVITSSYYRGC
jgi:hypothetical protein